MQKTDFEETNRMGYNKLANEFTEEKRKTTANFHQLSREFFQMAINRYLKEGDVVLELGPGRGWLRENIEFPNVIYKALDIAERMKEFNKDIMIGSAEHIPLSTDSVDIVIASLADPYLYEGVLFEISRVLKKGGFFIFSTPSNEWAVNLRGKSGKSEFKKNDEIIRTYSFTYEYQDMISLWYRCGLYLKNIETHYGNEISGQVSKDIIKAADNKKINYKLLDILTTAIFVKK